MNHTFTHSLINPITHSNSHSHTPAFTRKNQKLLTQLRCPATNLLTRLTTPILIPFSQTRNLDNNK